MTPSAIDRLGNVIAIQEFQLLPRGIRPILSRLVRPTRQQHGGAYAGRIGCGAFGDEGTRESGVSRVGGGADDAAGDVEDGEESGGVVGGDGRGRWERLVGVEGGVEGDV
jgi:hypothetical protein